MGWQALRGTGLVMRICKDKGVACLHRKPLWTAMELQPGRRQSKAKMNWSLESQAKSYLPSSRPIVSFEVPPTAVFCKTDCKCGRSFSSAT